MIGFQKIRLLPGLLIAALLIGACGSPAPAPTTTPPDPTPILPSGTATVLTPIYPGPGDAAPTPAGTAYPPPANPLPPATAYPAPADPGAAPSPYPAPTTSGTAPGGGAANITTIAGAPAGSTPISSAAVVATYPHDAQAYTQGLVYIGNDTFYESAGWYADSNLREVALGSGAVQRKKMLSEVLPADDQGFPFAEGIAVVGQRIFQLTWQHGVGVIYDLSFNPVGQFTYPPPGQPGPVEGWGLTYDPAAGRLIMGDGTANLYFVDPDATARAGVLAITGQVLVRDGAGNPVGQLNELELINGEVFANIYGSDQIARIDPASGRVNSFIDLSGLRALMPPQGPEVLNGIAYDAAADRLFVTGKYWPSLFEIDLPVARAYLPVTLVVPPARPATQWS